MMPKEPKPKIIAGHNPDGSVSVERCVVVQTMPLYDEAVRAEAITRINAELKQELDNALIRVVERFGADYPALSAASVSVHG